MRCLSALIVLLLGCLAYAAPPGSLEISTFYYPPYMMESKRGSVEGLMVEIFEQTIKPLGLKPDYYIFPLRRSVVEMQKPRNIEKFVHLGTALNFKNEISTGVFSDITMITGAFAAYVPRRSAFLRGPSVTVEMLRSSRVAALRGSAVVPILKHSGINPLEVSNIEQLFKVLDANRVDVSLVLDLSGDFYLKDHPHLKIAKVPSSITNVPLSFLIAKSHPLYDKIFPMISENLAKMRLNGELKTIAERYYGAGKVPIDVLSK